MVHKITLLSKTPGLPLTGINTILEIDGKPLRGVTEFKVEVGVGKLAKVTIEMCADFAMCAGIGHIVQKTPDQTVTIKAKKAKKNVPDQQRA